MDCQELQRFIHAYLDGEFAEEDGVAYAAHLSVCDNCREIALFEEKFRRRVRHSAPAIRTPAALRARICNALDAVESTREPPWWKRPWFWRLTPLSMGTAAAMVVASVTTGSMLGGPQPNEPIDDLAQASVRWHRTQLPLDVRASSPGPIRRWFTDKVPFAVRPPRFAPARLVGARLSHLRQHEAAYLVYQSGEQRVSVFVVDRNAMPRSGRVEQVGRRRIYWREVGGYQVAFFRHGGTGYAIASDMDRGQLVRLISSSD